MYETGRGGVGKNQTRAYESYKKAIALGYAPAMYNLGSIYAKQKDYANARLWWEKAAELDLPEAQYNMGMLYEKGWGVNVDPQVSLNWYQRAAETAMEKYFQLFQKSRSERQDNSAVNEISLSIVDRLAFIKTASAASEQFVNTADINPVPADLLLAQGDSTQKELSVTDSSGRQQPPGWDWIYSEPKQNFTIQLFATKDPGKTEKFIQQYALSERAHVIQAIVKGTTYYKVLIGSFTEWNNAAVEIGTFPQDLRNQRPWVRKFVSLYDEMPQNATVTEKQQAITQQPVNSVDDNSSDPDSTNNSEQKSVELQPVDETSSQKQAKIEQLPEILEPSSELPEKIPVKEESVSEVSASADDAPEKRSGNNNQDSQQQSLQSGPAVDDIVTKDNPKDADEIQVTDDVFTIYAKQQLTSGKLSDEQAAKLVSGLESIQAGDHKSGADQLSALAESGLPEAQYRVALLYSRGQGVEQDAVKAFDLMKSASEQGHPYAQRSLAEFYINGIGVDANSSLAAYWQQTAVDNLKKLENN